MAESGVDVRWTLFASGHAFYSHTWHLDGVVYKLLFSVRANPFVFSAGFGGAGRSVR
jgi:hypothetical protein